jgi:hypothetical protein
MPDQVKIELTSVYCALPASQVEAWLQGVDVMLDLVRQAERLSVVAGAASQELTADEKIPNFTSSLCIGHVLAQDRGNERADVAEHALCDMDEPPGG